MSVPSSKVTVSCEKPNLETDRTSISPGNPEMTFSTGIVICCSTSSGVREGATVLTCTWTGVVSGKASMGRFHIEYPPQMTKPMAPSNTISRLRSDHPMIQFNIRKPRL